MPLWPKETELGEGGEVKLEQQVSSLDPSRRLKKLGVKQESYFWWEPIPIDFDVAWRVTTNSSPCGELYDRGMTTLDCISAFTVAELGDMLATHLRAMFLKDDDGLWVGSYERAGNRHGGFKADTEADARAKMLIHLIEQGIIKP